MLFADVYDSGSAKIFLVIKDDNLRKTEMVFDNYLSSGDTVSNDNYHNMIKDLEENNNINVNEIESENTIILIVEFE